MTELMQKSTCDGLSSPTGRCDPRHPLHCCHFSIGRTVNGKRGYVCVKCGRPSRTWTPYRGSGNEPQI